MERKHIIHLQWNEIPESGAGWALAPDDNDVEFFCPNCHHWAGMSLHTIDSNGEVNASVLCANKKKVKTGEDTWERVPCDYHEFVVFDGWNPQHTKVAGETGIRS